VEKMVDSISVEALDSLSAVLAELLRDEVGPLLEPALEVHPLRIVPTGLGGFVGLSHEPAGEIYGRRLEASARVAVKAAGVGALSDAVTAVTRALLAADRQVLRSKGILRLDLESVGPQPAADAAGVVEREVQVKVLFEFLKRPTEAGGIIRRIPLDLELGRGTPMRTLLDTRLGTGALPLFEVFDDPDATGRPSDWRENAAEERIEQCANVSSSVKLPENPRKEGTYLVLRTAPSRPPVRDFLLRTTLRSGAGGIGLVFRWQDVDNFYFFLMHTDAERSYRVLSKKVGGAFAALETPALDKTLGCEPGRLYDVKLSVERTAFAVSLDGERVLEGEDGALPGPGRVGLLSRNNKEAFFYQARLVEI
jgi:hypothetical protein